MGRETDRRLEELEKRVKELEARPPIWLQPYFLPPYPMYPAPYPVYQQPYVPYQYWVTVTTTPANTNTIGTITFDNGVLNG